MQRPQANLRGAIPLVLSSLFFETHSFTSGTCCQSGQDSCPRGLRDLPVCVSPLLSSQVRTTMPLVFTGELNSDPSACMASILPAGVSPHPLSMEKQLGLKPSDSLLRLYLFKVLSPIKNNRWPSKPRLSWSMERDIETMRQEFLNHVSFILDVYYQSIFFLQKREKKLKWTRYVLTMWKRQLTKSPFLFPRVSGVPGCDAG